MSGELICVQKCSGVGCVMQGWGGVWWVMQGGGSELGHAETDISLPRISKCGGDGKNIKLDQKYTGSFIYPHFLFVTC